MTPMNFEIGMSASASSGASAGAGDFILKGGGGSSAFGPNAKATGAQSIPLWLILVGAVAGLLGLALLLRRKRRR